MKRPLVGGCLILILFLLSMHLFFGEAASERKRPLGKQVDENGQTGTITGTVKEITEKEKQIYYVLKKCVVQFPGQENSSDNAIQNNLNQNILNQNNLNQNNLNQYEVSEILCKISKTKKSDNKISIGNRIQVTGLISLFPTATNPGGFDAQMYYRAKQLYYQCDTESFRIEKDTVNQFRQGLFFCRKKLKLVYQDCLPEKEAGIVSAMLLGDKSDLDEDIKQLYQKNGISHILAISGLHISMLGMIFFGMLKRLGIKEIPACAGSMAFIVLYGILTGFSVSTNRAVVMLLMALFAKIVGRTYDRKTALAASAILILLQRPYELFSAGFLLSFGAVIGIAYIAPVLQQICLEPGKRRRQRSNLKKTQAGTELANSFKNVREKLLETVLYSISIQLATMPLLLWFYYELPPYSLLLNLFLLPLMSYIVLLAVLGGMVGIFWPFAGAFFMGGVYYILQFYELVCRQMQRIPFSSVILGRPTGFQMILYYFFLSMFLIIGTFYQRKMVFCLLTGLCVLFVPVPIKGLEITFLDVGQGDGIVLRTADMVFMIDGGSSSEKELARYDLVPYLKSQGIRKIDYALATHMDADHISGLQELLTEDYGIKIDTLLLSETVRNEEACLNLVKAAEKRKCKVRYLKRGDFMRDGLLYMRCLHPDFDFLTEDRNTASLTISLQYGEIDVLFTGDLEETGENYLLEQEKEQPFMADMYEILKVGHHGSKYSTTVDFLNRLQPKLSVISAGRQNRYGHPHMELLERLEERDVDIYQTKESGAIRICTDGISFSIKEYTKGGFGRHNGNTGK